MKPVRPRIKLKKRIHAIADCVNYSFAQAYSRQGEAA